MKGVILVDKCPENCTECDYVDIAYDDSCSCILKRSQEIDDPEFETPEWCPIRPLPVKLSPDKPGYTSQYSKGWDAALEEIGYWIGGERYEYHKRNERNIPKENDLYDLDFA